MLGQIDGQVQIQTCSAGVDGGAIYALISVRFVSKSSNYSSEQEEKPETTITGNVAGARGGGIAAWETIFVDFGHPLVESLKPVHSNIAIFHCR